MNALYADRRRLKLKNLTDIETIEMTIESGCETIIYIKTQKSLIQENLLAGAHSKYLTRSIAELVRSDPRSSVGAAVLWKAVVRLLVIEVSDSNCARSRVGLNISSYYVDKGKFWIKKESLHNHQI